MRAKISFYAEAAVAQAWEGFADEPVAQRRHMRSLTKSEYVLIEKGHSQADGTTNTWTVSEYPASVLHDDWYGRSVGASSYYEGYIMKSTGESFSKTEGEWLDAAVRQTTWQAPEFWQSVTIRESRNRILVALVPLTREVRRVARACIPARHEAAGGGSPAVFEAEVRRSSRDAGDRPFAAAS